MRKAQENIYRQIREAINNLPDNFSILEEQIDVELQLQYFNSSKDLKNEFSKEYIIERKDDLFDERISLEEKKNLLVLLASVNEASAYRAIEKFVKNPVPELKEWSVLALQESRMLLQSTFLEEQQVFISTGLGGQGQKLRYFVVLRAKDLQAGFTNTQKQLVESELIFSMKAYNGIFEEIEFEEGFVKVLFLMPLKGDMQEMFRTFVDECNQYGNFLDEDIILTNVRKFEISEIRDFLNNELAEKKEEDEE
jgi:hypothetical protein